MDYSGWKETLFAEGRERFKSTGELEERILELVRNQVEANGLLTERKQPPDRVRTAGQPGRRACSRESGGWGG